MPRDCLEHYDATEKLLLKCDALEVGLRVEMITLSALQGDSENGYPLCQLLHFLQPGPETDQEVGPFPKGSVHSNLVLFNQ